MNLHNFLLLVIFLASSCTHQEVMEVDHDVSSPVYDGQVLVPMPPVAIE